MRYFAMFVIAAACCVVEAGAQTILERAQRDETVSVPNDDPDMAAAMRKARATLPEFFALARAPKSSMANFAIKVGVRADNGDNEYFWVRPFEKKADRYSGRLRNTPRMVKNLKEGDTITFTENEIVDWTYLDNGMMKGNFTACALLKREPKESAEAFKKQYGLECDL